MVYGGEDLQQRTPGRLIPWRLVRSAALPDVDPLVQVLVDGRPVAAAEVLALLPDGMWQSARTDERGRAALDLASRHLPLTLFVAKVGFAVYEEPSWIPDERALHVHLQARPGAGAGVLEGVSPGSEVTVQVEGKAVNIDLVEGEHRVLKIEAAEGPDPTEPGWALPRQFLVRVVKVVDGAALLEYGPASHHSAVEA